MFWSATAPELEMAMEGLSGNFKGSQGMDRERVRRLAALHGPTKSLKQKSGTITLGHGRNSNDAS